MGRVRCSNCEQSTAADTGSCEFCGHVLDAARAKAEGAATMRRAHAALPADSEVTAPPAESGRRSNLLPVGDLFSQTMDVYAENVGAFTLLTAITLIPILAALYAFAILARQPGLSARVLLLSVLGPVLIAGALSPASSAAVTFGVVRQLGGRPASLGECLRGGLAGLLPALAAAIATGLLVLLGSVLFYFPGLFLGVVLFVATPAAVVERVGPLRALERSRELTRGARWPIFGLVVGIAIVSWIVERGLAMFSGSLLQIPWGYLLVPIPAWFGMVLAGSFHATGAAVAYCRLQEVKGERSVRELAADL